MVVIMVEGEACSSLSREAVDLRPSIGIQINIYFRCHDVLQPLSLDLKVWDLGWNRGVFEKFGLKACDGGSSHRDFNFFASAAAEDDIAARSRDHAPTHRFRV